jgi:hypothetical protein
MRRTLVAGVALAAALALPAGASLGGGWFVQVDRVGTVTQGLAEPGALDAYATCGGHAPEKTNCNMLHADFPQHWGFVLGHGLVFSYSGALHISLTANDLLTVQGAGDRIFTCAIVAYKGDCIATGPFPAFNRPVMQRCLAPGEGDWLCYGLN